MKTVALRTAGAVVTALAASACLSNTAPGNDREAGDTPPAGPAAVRTAEQALANVDRGLLQPQIITDADRRSLPTGAGPCTFRMTRVGFPVFAFGEGGSGVLKLNGSLVPLPPQGYESGASRYAAGPVDVTLRRLEADAGRGELTETELVLRFEGAPNELGFHGYADC